MSTDLFPFKISSHKQTIFASIPKPITTVPNISVIVPILNEAENIRELHQRLIQTSGGIGGSFNIVFVDDGSTDNSLDIIKNLSATDPHTRYISFTRNFGHQIAIHAGLEHCTGTHIVIMDGDLQNPPELIPAMVNKMNEGFEVVYAKRKLRKEESFMKKMTASLFIKILNGISDVAIPADTGEFRIISDRVAKELGAMKDHNKFIRGEVSWTGFKQAFIEYEGESRHGGKSTFTYRKMISLAIDGITGFSNFPLKFASLSGIFISMVAFLWIIYVLVQKLIMHQTVSGWASIMVAVLFLGGIQLLSIGIIGEYISRINDATRNRPLYIIRESNTK
jgi:polyisoprenyl-phosphate glycosyltransferase